MKIPHKPIRSSLAGHVASIPGDEIALRKLRTTAWLQQGVVVVRLADVRDDWDRLHLSKIASELYGQRKEAS